MSDVDIKVSKDVIKGIIEAKVQTAITEAMSSERGVVERLVAATLDQKVDTKGQRSTYRDENKQTYLEYLCRDVLQEGAKEAIKLWAEERKEVLMGEFLRQLQTKQTSNLLVKACVEGITEAVSSHWRFSVKIGEEK